MMEWTPIKGLQWTCEKIFFYGLKDIYGTIHEPHGAMTWQSTYYFHVCLDAHPFLGNRIHPFTMEAVRQKVLAQVESGEVPRFATVRKTGAGYLIGGANNAIRLTKKYNGGSDMSEQAISAVEDYLNSIGRKCKRNTNYWGQIKGIDIILLDGSNETIEVKARDGWYDNLFIQISETNPDKKIR